jgi:propanol-preferring alcohol dehydrogenase
VSSSIWGSIPELHELLDYVRREGVAHHVETLPLDQAQEALDRLRRGEIRGRVVLTVDQLAVD